MTASGRDHAATQRAILLFVADTAASDDLRHLLGLPDSRPFHPPGEGWPRVPQEPWTDDECRDFAWTLLNRLTGKVDWSAVALVPRDRLGAPSQETPDGEVRDGA